MKVLFPAISCLLVAVGCEGSRATNSPVTEPDRAARTDASPANTGVNARDRDQSAVTPLDQSEAKRDVEMTANIRKQVVSAKLSTDATNAKIITQDGHVTLRGPVDSAAEKSRVQKIAEQIAGSGNVDNQLEVASDR